MTTQFDLGNYRLLAGVDEAGRGPLAGPVIAAAVILDTACTLPGLADSKLLSPKQREALAREIQVQARDWAVGRAEVEEIDRLNIHHATLLAMQRAVMALSILPEHVVVDGKFCPTLSCTAQAIINGDALVPVISAASILAKVVRDREMVHLDSLYPGYGLAQHKGYPTAIHLKALKQLGVSPIHRRSYAPVKALLQDHAVS